MKFHTILLATFLLFCGYCYSQGSSCASPIALNVDGVLRTYPASSSTGPNVLCTDNGTTPITWFRFTSNAQGNCPLFSISASDSSALEVGFYTGCGSLLSTSSMCFYNGYGLWAPNENLVIPPSTTYFIRVKTATACNISIAAQHYMPPNENCLGAVSLGAQSINDNNACHHIPSGVTPAQLCAITLENTAWYTFFVATTGYSIITISNIQCNNGNANNNTGFQIGFFTGTCSSLVSTNCYNGSGTTVQATTTLLDAGTQVFVAIDGISGSNCTYTVSGVNTLGVLSGNLKNFSGWKNHQSNFLQWTTISETGGRYIIERSVDGINFNAIGEVPSNGAIGNNANYRFEDAAPPLNAYYRLRQINNTGKFALSNTINLTRQGLNGIQMDFANPANGFLQLNISIEKQGNYNCSIINMQGQKLVAVNKFFTATHNQVALPIYSFPRGKYAVIVENGDQRSAKFFVKQ